MNIIYGVNGHSDTEFWWWCYRHDLAQEMRKAKRLYVRLVLYRTCQRYIAMCKWGIPSTVASALAWSRLVRYCSDKQPSIRRK